MSSTHRPVYGATWSHCSVIYGEDDCVGDPCKNEAYCMDKYDSYECICRPGWSGDSCDREIMVEYTIHMTTSSIEHADTANALFVQFVGTEGDMSKEHMLTSSGMGAFERSVKDSEAGTDGCPNLQMWTDSNKDGNPGVMIKTITAQDIGELHKVIYRVGGDDSFKPSQLRVEHKGVMHAAVGELAASEATSGVSVTMVRARKYALDVEAVDTPEWAGTANDVYVQLTGENWEVTGEVVAIPGGIDDDVSCQIDFYGADVGTPAKITYWVSSSVDADGQKTGDDFLPGLMQIDDQYRAVITTGDRCFGKEFLGNDEGRDYGFEDDDCVADDDKAGCSGVAGCRSCAMWDPRPEDDEVLCPWVLPFTDGRYIIVDLIDQSANNATTTAEADTTVADTVAPTIISQEVENGAGTTLVLTFDETPVASALSASDFLVDIGDGNGDGAPTAAVIDGDTIKLTITDVTDSSWAVTFSYTASGVADQDIADAAGNLLADVSAVSVTNSI